MTQEKQSLCERVAEAMAELLDGSADDELVEHVAACDRCRDARHDAELARDVAADSGADYAHPGDFEARIERALAAREAAPARSSSTAESGPLAPPPPPRSRAQRIHRARAWLRRPRNTLAAGLVGAAAVAATVALVTAPPDPTEQSSTEGWTGKVAKISRAAGGGGGLELCDAAGAACQPASPGAALEAGAVLKTDDRTRVYLEMADGSRMALDRSTELALDEEGGRRAKLTRGAIVADVAKQENRPARIALPRGHVEVLGTKFALRTMGEAAAVDVSRGAVLLVDEGERSVKVRAGEEGRSYPGVPPYATAAPRLGDALSWSETNEDETIAVRGLGELKAKKPGEKEERRGAVRLTTHKVKVRVVDGFARTEIDETFTNTTDEVLEGIYRFPLPPDAQIERLALEVDGKMEEGAFVDRDRAAAIWRGAIVNAGAQRQPREEIVWVPGPWKDPALLEWQRGGRFELRIFPIPKQGSRRVVLTYTQVVKPAGGIRRYVYPLAHDPSGALRVDRFEVDAQVRGHDPELGVTSVGYDMRRGGSGDVSTLRFDAGSFVPSGDLVIEYATRNRDAELSAWAFQPSVQPEARAESSARAKAADRQPPTKAGETASVTAATGVDDASPYLALALRPKLPRRTEDSERAFVLVVDASRSMYGERYDRAGALVSRVVNELDRLDRFTVLACDSTCRALPGGLRAPGNQAADEVKRFLDGITPEGASDVAASMREAAAAASQAEGRSVRIVYVGDGTPTVGPIRPADLDRAAREAVPSGRGTVTTVAIGADADLDTLGALARGGGGTLLPYVPGQKVGEAAYAVLGASYGMGLRDVRLELPGGLVEVAPRELGTIAAGSEAIVVARMTSPRVNGTVVLRGKVGGESFEQRYPLDVAASGAPAHAFVQRLFAAARIADLERDGGAAARERAIALSGAFNVQSRYTSLLVLESPAMFRAFGLDNVRRAAEWTGEDDLATTRARGEVDVPEGDTEAKDENSFVFGYGEAEEKRKKETAEPFGGGGTGTTAGAPRRSRPPSTSARPPPSPQPRPSASSGPAPAAEMDRADPFTGADDARERKPGKKPAQVATTPPSDPFFGRGGGRMVPMRRIFERRASIVTSQTSPTTVTATAIAEAERELANNENRREAVKSLYVLLMRAGQLDRAADLAERWSEKEPLDPEALTARADLAARRGRRDEAIRILGSVVDVRPGDVGAHKRLSRLHRWAGRGALGCRHDVAIAQMRPDDAELLAEAVLCGRKNGESRLVDEMLSRAGEDTRKGAERTIASNKETTGVQGEIKLEAKWEGGQDLDVALIHPTGLRISWLGAPSRELISAEDVLSTRREALGLLGSQSGEYVLEVVRASGEGPVRGELVVRVPGDTRTIPFVLEGDRLALGTVQVRFESRLVPF